MNNIRDLAERYGVRIPEAELAAAQGPVRDRIGASFIPASHSPAELTRCVMPVPKDATPEVPQHRHDGPPSSVWDYRDERGQLLFKVCRWDDVGGEKQIRPLTYRCDQGGSCGWEYKGPDAPKPLYGLDRLAARPTATVLLVEGEKTANSAAKLFPELVVITSSGGSGAAGKSSWSALKGRNVILWPDHDDAGQRYAYDVARLIAAAGAASMRLVSIPKDWSRGWDLADFGDGGRAQRLDVTVETLTQMLQAAMPIVVAARDSRPLNKAEAPPSRSDAATRGRGLSTEAREPWPMPVDGAELLGEILGHVQRHMQVSLGQAHTIAFWVLSTYTIEVAQFAPRLAIVSPEKQCGKTTLLEILHQLASKPMSTASISSASLFRVVQAIHPTLLVDEADSFLVNNDELRGLINTGYRRGTCIIRCAPDSHEPRAFDVFGALALAAIGSLPGTIEDRAHRIELKRARHDEKPQRITRVDRATMNETARKCARWALDNVPELDEDSATVPDWLGNRQADNWRHVFAIAGLVGGPWPAHAEEAARMLSGGDAAKSDGVVLLGDLKRLFAERNTDRLSSEVICSELIKIEERPWSEISRGKPITPTALARMLRAYQIAPNNIRLAGGITPKGYLVKQFADAFSRYVSPEEAPQRHNPQSAAVSASTADATPHTVWRHSNGSEVAESLACGGVAAAASSEGPQEPGIDEIEL